MWDHTCETACEKSVTFAVKFPWVSTIVHSMWDHTCENACGKSVTFAVKFPHVILLQFPKIRKKHFISSTFSKAVTIDKKF